MTETITELREKLLPRARHGEIMLTEEEYLDATKVLSGGRQPHSNKAYFLDGNLLVNQNNLKIS